MAKTGAAESGVHSGKSLDMSVLTELEIEELLSQFETKAVIGGGGECWDWIGSSIDHANPDNWQPKYGIIRIQNSYEKAHRISFALFKEPVPEGMLVRHSCDNPSCVNPHHLSLGWAADNARDRTERGRSYMNRTLRSQL